MAVTLWDIETHLSYGVGNVADFTTVRGELAYHCGQQYWNLPKTTLLIVVTQPEITPQVCYGFTPVVQTSSWLRVVVVSKMRP